MLCKRDISTSTCSELQTIRLPFCHKLILDFQFSSLLQISHYNTQEAHAHMAQTDALDIDFECAYYLIVSTIWYLPK
jgi:hypothetical protein